MAFSLAEMSVSVGADLFAFNRAMGVVEGRLRGLAATRIVLPGAGLAALAGAGVVAGIGAAIRGASHLSETLSKVGVVFKDQAKVVTDAAQEMANRFGVPRREFLDAASSFGLMGKAAGLTAPQVAEMSTRLARLAIDASSFYDVDTSLALERIRSGLAGEAEPMRAFGVLLSEAAVKAEALRLGLAGSTKELTEGAKVQARASLIVRGLADASGDYERTAGGVENQTRRFWGSIENLSDTIGTALLPSMGKLLSVMNTVAADMQAATDSGIGNWANFFDFVEEGVGTIGVIYRNWGDVVELVTLEIQGHLAGIGERVDWLGDTHQAFLDWFGEVWPLVFSDAFSATLTVMANFKENFLNFVDELVAYVTSGFQDPIEIKFKPLFEGFEANTPAFKAPEFQPSDPFADAKRVVRERMAARESAQPTPRTGRPGAGVGVGAGLGLPGGLVSSSRVGVTDIEGYQKELQEAALRAGGKADVEEDQLAEAQATNKKLDEIKDALKDNRGARNTAVYR